MERWEGMRSAGHKHYSAMRMGMGHQAYFHKRFKPMWQERKNPCYVKKHRLIWQGGFLSMLYQKTWLDMTGRVSLLAILKTMESVVQTYMGFGTHIHTHQNPYLWIWVQVSNRCGCGYSLSYLWITYNRLYYSHSTLFHFRLRLILRKSMPEFQHISD